MPTSAERIDIMTNYELMNLCIEKQYFTHGSTEQYNRLFDLNADGVLRLKDSEYLLDAVTRVIWICSEPENTYDSIKEALLKREAEELRWEEPSIEGETVEPESEIRKLHRELERLLNMAPIIDDCTEKENAMYSDIANLKESIFDYLEEDERIE